MCILILLFFAIVWHVCLCHSYNNLDIWADKSVTYYMPNKLQCLRLHNNLWQSRSGRPNYVSAEDAICETDHHIGITSLPSWKIFTDLTKTLPMPSKNFSQSLVECRQGFFMFSFLACDDMNVCWAKGDNTERTKDDFSGVPTRDKCPAAMTLLPPSMMCNDGIRKVVYSFVCDGRPDCVDSSDENFCVWPKCGIEAPLRCSQSQTVG